MTVLSDAFLPFTIEAMTLDDIPQIMAIERHVFADAWSSGIYRRELTANPWSHYLLLRSTTKTRPDPGEGPPPILAYGGVWQIDAAAHIPTIAVHPAYLRRGLGGFLLLQLMLEGRRLGCAEATLEVRLSNSRAQIMYERHGFRVVGKRRGYYSNNREDALIMTRPTLDEAELRAELAAAEARLRRKLAENSPLAPEQRHG